MKIMNNQAFSKIWIIVILVALIGGGILIGNYLSILNIQNNNEMNEEISENETADWKTYTNEEYGFELKYPKKWSIKEEVKNNIDSIKEKYSLDIFHPENITEAKIYGNVTIEFFDLEDNDKFFEYSRDMLKRNLTLTVEEITVNDVKGFKGTAYEQIDKAKSMYISEIFQKEKGQGIFRISVWTIDLGKETYQEQANLILSTFKFLE